MKKRVYTEVSVVFTLNLEELEVDIPEPTLLGGMFDAIAAAAQALIDDKGLGELLKTNGTGDEQVDEVLSYEVLGDDVQVKEEQ